MLLQRVATAVILIAVFLVANFWLPQWVLLLLISLFTLLAAREWAALVLENKTHQYFYVLALSALLAVMYYMPSGWVLGLMMFAGLWWLFRIVLLVTGRLSFRREHILLSGLWVLSLCWLAAITLHGHSPVLLLIGLLWIWGADSFAYFAGKRYGRRKLAASISPGKTVEGVMAGVAGVVILAVLSGMVLTLHPAGLAVWILAAVSISLISVGGDLYESWLKRQAGVKDSGSLLPGHGGVLDRVDGLIAAMPFYYMLCHWLILK